MKFRCQYCIGKPFTLSVYSNIRDANRVYEHLHMTCPDPKIIPQFTAAQYASTSDPPDCADVLNDTYILEDNIGLVRPSDRGERVIFIHNTGKVHMGQKLQDGKKVLCVSLNSPHSENRPGQTACPSNLPFWIIG